MKNIGFLFLVIVFFSCQVPKEKMTGRNIRLWQDTPAWELAKAVRAETHLELIKFY